MRKKNFPEALEKLKSNDPDFGGVVECEYEKGSITNEILLEILEAYKTNTHALSLDIYGKTLDDILITKLTEVLLVSNSLKFISLMECNITASMAGFSEALASNNTVDKLWLNGSTIPAGCVGAIGDALKTNSRLTLLDLSSVKVPDGGIIMPYGEIVRLAKGLRVNTKLKILNLCDARITINSAQEIFRAMKVNNTLIQLSLDENLIGDDAWKELYEFLTCNQSIQTLWIAKNEFMHEKTSTSLAGALRLNSTLIDLKFFHKDIPYIGKIQAAIMGNARSNILFFDCKDEELEAELKERQQISNKLVERWVAHKKKPEEDIQFIVLHQFSRWCSATSCFLRSPYRKAFREESRELAHAKVNMWHLGIAKDISPLVDDVFLRIYEYLNPGDIVFSSTAITLEHPSGAEIVNMGVVSISQTKSVEEQYTGR